MAFAQFTLVVSAGTVPSRRTVESSTSDREKLAASGLIVAVTEPPRLPVAKEAGWICTVAGLTGGHSKRNARYDAMAGSKVSSETMDPSGATSVRVGVVAPQQMRVFPLEKRWT